MRREIPRQTVTWTLPSRSVHLNRLPQYGQRNDRFLSGEPILNPCEFFLCATPPPKSFEVDTALFSQIRLIEHSHNITDFLGTGRPHSKKFFAYYHRYNSTSLNISEVQAPQRPNVYISPFRLYYVTPCQDVINTEELKRWHHLYNQYTVCKQLLHQLGFLSQSRRPSIELLRKSTGLVRELKNLDKRRSYV